MKKILLASLISFVSISSAYADDNQVYMGLEGGYSKADFSNFSLNLPEPFADMGSTSSTNNGQAYGTINFGVLAPVGNDWYLGGQLGLGTYGQSQETINTHASALWVNTSSVTTYTDSYQDISLQAVAQKYFGQFFINLHAGVAEFVIHQTATQTITLDGIPTNSDMSSQNGTSYATTGIGGLEIGYQFNDHFNTYLAYNHVVGTGDNFQVVDMDSVGLGVNYLF